VINPKVLLKQRCRAKDIEIVLNSPSKRILNPLIEEKIPEIWKKMVKEAEGKQITIWDGTYYRLENIKEVIAGLKRLELGTIKYSALQAYKIMSKQIELTADEYTNFISTIGITKTTDNYYVFGLRGKTVHSDNIDFIGGGLQEDEIVVTYGLDIERSQYKEMKEEANILIKDISKCEMVGILRSTSMNVLFVFEIDLNISKNKVMEKFKQRSDNEMQELIFVERNNLENYLKALPGYRPLVWDLLT
jgi:hypothetical protein